MPAPQRFIAQLDNALAAAVLSASTVQPSAALRTLPSARVGSARVALQGDYTGAESTTLDLQIVQGGPPRASAAAFAGVGNGTLDVLGVDPAAPLQTLTLTLASTGTRTTPAVLELGAVRLVAKAAGAAGNAITLTVTPQLTRTPLGVATLDDWPAGQATQPGAQWDVLGGAPLKSDGSLDTAMCPRVQFGEVPTVYRVYQTYKEGAWQTGLSPAPAKPLPKGTAVQRVEGDYAVTVTDGTLTETYPGLRSLYDLLLALAASALVRVDGAVTQDQAPGGMDAIDLPLRTAAWVQALRGSIKPTDLSIAPSAPTQTVRVQCVDATLPGAEVWSVTGDVSGRLPNAVTGAAYTSDVLGFTLPLPQQVSGGQSATVSSLAGANWQVSLQPRKDTEAEPIFCARVVAGSRAGSGGATFTYKRRPPAANCPCPSLPALSSTCLGLSVNTTTGGTSMADLDPTYQTRLRALYGWREGLAKANTSYAGATSGVPSTPETWGYDVVILPVPGAVTTPTVRVAIGSLGAAQISASNDWGGVVVTSGSTVQGSTVTFSNGKSGTLMTFHSSVIDMAGVAANQNTALTGYAIISSATPAVPGVPPHFDSAPIDLDWVDNVVRILSGCLATVYTVAPAVAKWDTLFADAQADCEVLRTLDIGLQANSARFLDRYKTTCDAILVEAGIVPKSDASSTLGAASGCWQDDPSKAYWWVDESGTYLPAFTNQAYYSARKDADGKPVSTQEFGLVIGCGCESLLKVGDRFTISINSAASGGDTVRRVGDTLELDIVGAAPQRLRGGSDGNDTLTWAVQGSVSGALPPYLLPFDQAVATTVAGVTLRITQGGIPFALGDTFTLATEAMQAQWRMGAQPWSAPVDLPAAGVPLPLGDGLSALFLPGPPPSLSTADVYSFALDQPHAPAHAVTPDADAWRWVGADALLTASFGSAQSVQLIAALMRDLPDTAQVFVQVSTDGTTWQAEQAVPIHNAIAVLVLPAPVSVLAVRWRLAGAEGAALVWCWAGMPRTTDYAATVVLRRQWALTQGDALNPSSLYAGSGMGGTVAWDVLSDADLRALLALLDDNQQHGWPLLFMPHVLHPQDTALVRVDASAIDLVDEFSYQPDASSQRLLKLTLPLQAVYQ